MNSLLLRLVIITVLILTALTLTFGQGLYWESTSTISVMGDKTTHSMTWYMPGMIKQQSPDEHLTTLILLDKQLIITANDKDKTYTEMTFEEMEASMKRVGGILDEKMKKMEEAMKDMPEEQRKMVQQMMGGKLPGNAKGGAIEVKKGTSKTVSGFACTEYQVTKDGNDFMTVWATKDVKEYDATKKDLREFSNRMAAMIPMVGTSVAEGMKKIEGFPIQMEIDGKMKTIVTKLEKRTTPAKDFEIPTGYTKVTKKEKEG
jgi:hypothetical protein